MSTLVYSNSSASCTSWQSEENVGRWRLKYRTAGIFLQRKKERKKTRFFEMFLPNEKAGVLQRCTLSRCQDVPQKHPWPAQPIFYCPVCEGLALEKTENSCLKPGQGLLSQSVAGRAVRKGFFPCRSNSVHVDLHDARKYHLIYPGSTFCADWKTDDRHGTPPDISARVFSSFSL